MCIFFCIMYNSHHMSQEEPISKQYDEKAPQYAKGQQEIFSEHNWQRELIHARLGGIEGKVIVDAGCGHGDEARALLKFSPKEIIAFDASRGMIELASQGQQDDRLHFLQASYEQIPIQDESVDILISSFSLHYSRNIDQAYSEIHRILVSGGKAVIVVPHPLDSAHRADPTAGEHMARVEIYPGVEVVYPIHSMEEYQSDFARDHFIFEQFEEVFLPNLSSNYPSVLAFALKKHGLGHQ